MAHWQKTLQELILFPELHGRFLNTLSLLEYVGARKIMKSQHEKHITPTLLAHMVEEIRHAQIFKKLALRVAGSAVASYSEKSLLCGKEARAYMQAIDQTACDVVGKDEPWANYLLTTLIVEERAQSLYPFYDELLCQLDLGGPLKAIVREEENHLEQVQESLSRLGSVDENRVAKLREIEKSFFDDFILRVSEQIKLVEKHSSEIRIH